MMRSHWVQGTTKWTEKGNEFDFRCWTDFCTHSGKNKIRTELLKTLLCRKRNIFFFVFHFYSQTREYWRAREKMRHFRIAEIALCMSWYIFRFTQPNSNFYIYFILFYPVHKLENLKIWPSSFVCTCNAFYHTRKWESIPFTYHRESCFFFFLLHISCVFRLFDFIIVLIKSQIDFSPHLTRIMFVIVWFSMWENVGGCELSSIVYALCIKWISNNRFTFFTCVYK